MIRIILFSCVKSSSLLQRVGKNLLSNIKHITVLVMFFWIGNILTGFKNEFIDTH